MSVVWTWGREGGREGAVGDFVRFPVTGTDACFIGLLYGNSDSSFGDFHALNLN